MKKNNIKKGFALLVLGITVFSKIRIPNQSSTANLYKNPQIEPISIYSQIQEHSSIIICAKDPQIEPISIY